MSSRTETSGTGAVVVSVWVLFLGTALLMAGNGLQGSLLGIRSDIEGFATPAIGIVMASYYAGFLVGSLTIPARLASVGHIRVFAGLASLTSSVALIHYLVVDEVTWSLLRFITGLCLSGLYVTIESWLNDRASNATRGRLLAVYMVVVTVSVGCGQLLLGAADPSGPRLFITASILISLAIVPLALSQIPAPALDPPSGVSIRALLRVAPLGVVTGALVGASNGAIFGLGAVYATRIGMSPGRAGLFVGASVVGAVITQYPLGHLSDRFPRRRVIFIAATAAVGVALLGTTVDRHSPLLFVVAALYGSLAFPMYSLAVSHINDIVRDDQLVSTAAGVLFVYGAGSIVGPIITSVLMTLFGPAGYLWSLSGFFAPVAAYSLYRLATKARPGQQSFVSLPPRTSVVAATLAETRPADDM
ncbi:MAG TPA: MFS transporter [Acidimicrobiia bacterium]|nr:MFS transporter [Acidimicrobiia bacterium]